MHRKHYKVALTTVGAIIALAAGIAASSAFATTQTTFDPCPANSPYASGWTCEYQPATKHVKQHVKVVIHKRVIQNVRTYERIKHVRVAVAGGSPLSGAGCIDPTRIAAWNVYDGKPFYNADKWHRELPDHWQKGWGICAWHVQRGWHGHHGLFVVGTKQNCKNSPIAIPIKGTKPPKVRIPVIEFRSVKSFEIFYEKWVSSTTSVTYTCPSNWILHYDGSTWVCYLPTPSTTTTATTVTTTVTTTTTTSCQPQSEQNQYGACVAPCPPGEEQFQGSPGYGWVDAGNGVWYSVYFNASRNGFWTSGYKPDGAVNGYAACYKPAPPPPPPSP